MTALKLEICLNGVTLLYIDKTLISHPYLLNMDYIYLYIFQAKYLTKLLVVLF